MALDGLERAAPATVAWWPAWDACLRRHGPTHVRQDSPDGSKAVYWRSPSGARGIGDHRLKDLVYAPDRVRVAMQADPRAWLVVTEGEKAADAVLEAGLLAVGTVCGASSTPGAAVVELLATHRVVLWPDADVVGAQHMGRLGYQLEAAGVPSLAIVRSAWPDAPKGADAADLNVELRRDFIAAAMARPIGPVAA